MNMKSRLRSFNIYLLAAAVLAGGCSSHRLSMNKQYATLNIFLEAERSAGSLPVQIGWNKTPMYIAPEPLLTEADLTEAALVDHPDGAYEIRLTFNAHGTLVLDMQTSSVRRNLNHLVIFAKFPPKGWKEPQEGAPDAGEKPAPGQPRISAWIAAPMIPPNGLSNGTLRFTPEVSHEEAEKIVEGLNNMATTLRKMEG